MRHATMVLVGMVLGGLMAFACQGAEPVALRVENLLVSPSHGPLARVLVANRMSSEYRGTVRLIAPAGWRVVPDRRDVRVAPGAVERVRRDRQPRCSRSSQPLPHRFTSPKSR